MIRASTKVQGRMLTDPKGWERDLADLVETVVQQGALHIQAGIVGSGGTLRNSPVSPGFDKTIFTGKLVADMSKAPIVEGNLREGYSASFGSNLPYAPVMEDGRRAGGKHPPFVGEKSFSVPEKRVQVRAGGGRKAHTRTIPAHRSTVKVSVLDKWIKKRMGVTGESLDDYRKRAGIAYRMGKRMKTKGLKGRKFIARAITKRSKSANALMNKLFKQGLAQIGKGPKKTV